MKWTTLLALVLILSGCGKTDEQLMVKQMLNNYYEALLLEDLNDSMRFIHPENEEYYRINEDLESTFAQYNYTYTTEGIEFTEPGSTRMVVKVLLRTKGIEEETGEPMDYELIHTYEVKKDSEGEWKILSEQMSPI